MERFLNYAATDPNVDIARRLELEVWSEGRVDLLDEIAADTYTVHDIGRGRTTSGRIAVKEYMLRFQSALAIKEVLLHDLVPSGSQVTVRWTLRATHVGEYDGITPTGLDVEARGVDVLRIDQGRLVEAWVISGDSDLQRQLRRREMTDADLRAWLESYAKAWDEHDADGVTALFTESGIYRSAPFRPAHEGRDAIRRYWLEEPQRHEQLDLRFGSPVVSGRRAAVEWWATMLQDGEPVTGPGCLVLAFDEHGLCQELREYWHEQPGRMAPPSGWGK
jgi:predicted ester cyclase